MNVLVRACPIVCAGLAVTAAVAGEPTATFEFIPDSLSANDMTPDGRFIVGEAAAGPYRYDRQTAEMLILAGANGATGVSDDGQVICGNLGGSGGIPQTAAVWTADTGWVAIGGFDTCGSLTTAYEISGDGTAVVGLAWEGCSGRGFRWTADGGMTMLENLANGGNRASVVSGDGTVVGGFAQGSFSRTPATWNDTTAGQLLDPPDGDILGEVHGMNDDGSVLLCEWDFKAHTWTEADGAQQIANGGLFVNWSGIPTDIADNGDIVGFDVFQTLRRAWIYTDGAMTQLDLWVEAHGGDVPNGTVLEVAQAISSDGTSIIGHGFFSGGWIVDITPAPTCTGDIDGDDLVTSTDLNALLAQFGQTGDDLSADLDDDGDVDSADLNTLLAAFGSAC